MSDDIERIAQAFHEAYERLAPNFGYRTRDESAKPWADVPAQNQALMMAVVGELLAAAELDATHMLQHKAHAIWTDIYAQLEAIAAQTGCEAGARRAFHDGRFAALKELGLLNEGNAPKASP